MIRRYSIMLALGTTLVTASSTALMADAPGAARAMPAQLIIPGERIFPESLTSAADGSIIVGSTGERAIFRALPGAKSALPWISLASVGVGPVLGVLADDASNTLWACTIGVPASDATPSKASILHAFDLKTGAARNQYPLPTPDALCNDIATNAAGDVFATDSINMEVLRLPRGGSQLEVWAGGSEFGPKDGVLDGIAVVGNAVIVNTLQTGKLYSVAIAADGSSGETTLIKLERALERPDGMRTFGKDGLLIAESGGVGRLIRVNLKDGAGNITSLREGFPGGPVSVTVVGKTAYVLEGQLALQAEGSPAPKPFQALAVSLVVLPGKP